MPRFPLVSVLVSCYNGEAYLQDALDSLLAQTYPRLEILIYEDGSTDGSRQRLLALAKKEGRLRLFLGKGRRGLTARLCELSRQARGKYLARQDIDDFSQPRRIERQVSYLEANPKTGLVGCAFELFDDEGPLYTTWEPNHPGYLRRKLEHKNFFSHGSLMFRRETFWRAGGYDPRQKMAQDYDLLLRMAQRASISYLPEVLYRLRLSARGLSIQGASRQERWRKIARKNAGLLSRPDLPLPPSLSARTRRAYLRGGHWIFFAHPSLRKIGWLSRLDGFAASGFLGPCLRLFERLLKQTRCLCLKASPSETYET